METVTVDCVTGALRRTPLTAAEIAEREARALAWQERLVVEAIEESARDTDYTAARLAVANLTAYADSTSPTNIQTVAAVKLLCRVSVILIKRALAS